MAFSLPQFLLGVVLAALIAYAAHRVRALSDSGAIAAGLLGTVFFGLGGLRWAALLLAFFISSSALSRLFRQRKATLDEKFSKGSERDAAQVAANGGVAGLFVLLHVFFPDALWPWWACAGALAADNADTWATKLGVLSRSAPRLITSLRPVERGTSGGISPTGTWAALAGGLLVGLTAALCRPGGPGSMAEIILAPLWIGLAGLFGSLVDSALGATLQAIYTCPACQKETERHPRHTCGTPTTLQRGLPWLDNDWVNTACTLAGALAGLLALTI